MTLRGELWQTPDWPLGPTADQGSSLTLSSSIFCHTPKTQGCSVKITFTLIDIPKGYICQRQGQWTYPPFSVQANLLRHADSFTGKPRQQHCVISNLPSQIRKFKRNTDWDMLKADIQYAVSHWLRAWNKAGFQHRMLVIAVTIIFIALVIY